jgi:hypothetical protein
VFQFLLLHLAILFAEQQATFKKAQFWVQELQCKGSPNVVIALAGNKVDLAQMRQVAKQVGSSFLLLSSLLSSFTFFFVVLFLYRYFFYSLLCFSSLFCT